MRIVAKPEITELIDFLSEILLLGTGTTVVQAPPAIRNYLKSLGVQLEVTSTVRLPLLGSMS